MSYWRLLDLEYADPSMNMAVEEAISKTVGNLEAPNTVRFWRNPNTVVIGRFQKPKSEIRFDLCGRYRTSFVRRFTGGGAVYQDLGNLNFSIFSQKSFVGFPDLTTLFKHCSMGVIQYFNDIGLNAKFEPVNKIMIGKRKVSGLAGSLKWNCLTVHGSILVKTNTKVLEEVLKSIKDPVTTLQEELGRSLSIPEIKRQLKMCFERSYQMEFVQSGLIEKEKNLAEIMFSQKYSRKKWNYESKF